jgi:prophage regulatory protein
MLMDTGFTTIKQFAPPPRVLRHKGVKEKLGLSSAKLFDMVAKGLFPRPFPIVPGGRAVGWLESDVDAWILEQQRQHKLGNPTKSALAP